MKVQDISLKIYHRFSCLSIHQKFVCLCGLLHCLYLSRDLLIFSILLYIDQCCRVRGFIDFNSSKGFCLSWSLFQEDLLLSNLECYAIFLLHSLREKHCVFGKHHYFDCLRIVTSLQMGSMKLIFDGARDFV